MRHLQRFLGKRITPVIVLSTACTLFLTSLSAQVRVNSAVQYNATGISMSAGDEAIIEGMGIVNLADGNGPYETDPAGKIFVVPPAGSGAYVYFQYQAAPIGIPPAKYNRKFLVSPGSGGPLLNAPYGALVAGISPSASPQSAVDFPNGFTYIGNAETIRALSDGYLYLSVNDNFPPLDNQGSYFAYISLE